MGKDRALDYDAYAIRQVRYVSREEVRTCHIESGSSRYGGNARSAHRQGAPLFQFQHYVSKSVQGRRKEVSTERA